MNILILAAGKGTRMKSSQPKVMQTIAGRPMIHHLCETAFNLPAAQVTVVTGHGSAEVQAYLKAQFPGVRFVEQSQQLGTGHAVKVALDHLNPDQATLVLYGDVPLTRAESMHALLEQAQQGRLALMTQHLEDPTGYGRILRDESHAIIGIVEQKDASAEQLLVNEVNTGLLACPTAELIRWVSALGAQNAQGEYYLTDIVAQAHMQSVPVVACQPAFGWEVSGVNSRAQQAELERAWQWHVANQLMQAGVQLADPTRLDVRGQLRCEPDVFIDVGCVFVGQVDIKSGAHIGPYCVIENTQIGQGARLEAYTHTSGAKLAQLANAGPFARLRPGAELAESVHVGNFVEIKNAQIGQGSKAGHLSYIGDALVGKNVNIGAGTITCNYDGANKHQTIIEDDAFIGSDTQLVAPVTVGKGATLGAGTTLTKDAPAGALTVSRARQASLSGWKRPVKIKKN